MKINAVQILGWTVGGCALLAGGSSAAQLTELFGGNIAGKVAAATGLVGAILAIPLGSLSSTANQVQQVVSQKDDPKVQDALVRTVASYPGVEPIRTNNEASATLMNLAADSSAPKVLPPAGPPN